MLRISHLKPETNYFSGAGTQIILVGGRLVGDKPAGNGMDMRPGHKGGVPFSIDQKILCRGVLDILLRLKFFIASDDTG